MPFWVRGLEVFLGRLFMRISSAVAENFARRRDLNQISPPDLHSGQILRRVTPIQSGALIYFLRRSIK